MSTDLYKLLEVEKGVDPSEIRKQYLRLSRVYHPDKAPTDKVEEYTAKFKEINRAYEILNDEEKRSFYDQTGQIPGEQGGPPPGSGAGPFGFGGGGMPFHFDMGDLFGMFGRGPGGPGAVRGGRRTGKAPSRKTQIPMTLKDFYYGRTLQIHLERNRFCSGCKGEGAHNIKSCADCQGLGMKTQVIQMGPMVVQNQAPCITCRGSGKSKGDACGQCNGTKFTKQDKTLELNIKVGMRPGDEITFAGEASQEEGYTEAGDVVVELVTADEDHGWERQGDVLRHRVGLTLGEALCGKVVRLDGHPAHADGVFIQIPAGVQNRQEIIVEGLGMPRLEGGGFAEAVLMITVIPTKEERAILEEKQEVLREVFSLVQEAEKPPLVWLAKPIIY
jgi:DnaJ-class molecular chaperone